MAVAGATDEPHPLGARLKMLAEALETTKNGAGFDNISRHARPICGRSRGNFAVGGKSASVCNSRRGVAGTLAESTPFAGDGIEKVDTADPMNGSFR